VCSGRVGVEVSGGGQTGVGRAGWKRWLWGSRRSDDGAID
jgi:hypothetical protein